MSSTLYIVATPIGNLGDISERALSILRSADLILTEDTRVTLKLLAHFDIHTPVKSYHAHSTGAVTEHILRLFDGDDVAIALVTDAGTPTISDPGAQLVDLVRLRFPTVAVVAIPGPSAVIAAVSISGIHAAQFTFLGFLPHKKGRETLFKEIAVSERAVVFYESPHRIEKTLESLADHLGSDRVVFVGRELTKVFEEGVRGSAEEVRDYYRLHLDKVRGEFAIVVSGLR
jgi:16S rRNA (cytidine1402-2'-O)-methyltransferase